MPVKFHKPILSTAEEAIQDGLKEGGREILQRARSLSPTDSGASDKSGFSLVDDLTMQVGFTSLVSRLQHEHLDWEHPDGGQPKFLETAGDEVDVEAIVAKKIRAAFSG